MPVELKEKTSGLCGYWDGNEADDWDDADGTRYTALPDFVSSCVDNSIGGLWGLFLTRTTPLMHVCILIGKCSTPATLNSPCEHEDRDNDDQVNFCSELEQKIFTPCFEVRNINYKCCNGLPQKTNTGGKNA
jgi:hypothetical protein